MRNPMRLFIAFIFLFTLRIVNGQEWYMKDSHMISDQEFPKVIIENKLSFKIVKYFTPWCRYCKDLKRVFDQLKQQKEWKIQFYDFNCNWYPQFCSTHVRSGSFPYTVVYDQNGDMFREIHGFFPQHIIKELFYTIEKASEILIVKEQTKETPSPSSLKREDEQTLTLEEIKPIPLPTQILPPKQQKIVQVDKKQEIPQNKEQVAHPKQEIAQVITPTPQKHQSTPTQQTKKQETHQPTAPQIKIQVKLADPPQIPAKIDEEKPPNVEVDESPQEIKVEKEVMKEIQKEHKESSARHSGHQHSNNHESSALKYVFYAICVVLGGYYLHSVTKGKQHSLHNQPKDNLSSTKHSQSSKTPGNPEVQIKQANEKPNQFDQSQLLSSLRDEQL